MPVLAWHHAVAATKETLDCISCGGGEVLGVPETGVGGALNSGSSGWMTQATASSLGGKSQFVVTAPPPPPPLLPLTAGQQRFPNFLPSRLNRRHGVTRRGGVGNASSVCVWRSPALIEASDCIQSRAITSCLWCCNIMITLCWWLVVCGGSIVYVLHFVLEGRLSGKQFAVNMCVDAERVSLHAALGRWNNPGCVQQLFLHSALWERTQYQETRGGIATGPACRVSSGK